MQLTYSRTIQWPMGTAIDDHAAGSAYPFTTVMFESNRLLLLSDQFLVEHIQHFQKGHMLIGCDRMCFKSAFIICMTLAPDMQG